MIALGTAQLTMTDLPQELIDAVIRTAATRGVRHVDTARCYIPSGASTGLGEARIARAIRRLPPAMRPRIGTKCGLTRTNAPRFVLDARPETIVRHCEDSLRHLGVDALDLMLLHWPDPAVPLRHSLRALEELKADGVARAIGVCNVDAETLAREGRHVALDVVQVRIDPTTLRDLLAVAAELRLTCQVYGLFDKPEVRERLRDGELLADLPDVRAPSNHAAVLAAVRTLWPTAVPLVGTTNPAHLEQLLSVDQAPSPASSREIVRRIYGSDPL